MSVEASPPVNLVVELPDPPLPSSALPADVGVLPPLSSAIGVDFGTATEPWFSSHSSTQTVPSETIDAEIQTTVTLAPPMVNSMSQTDPLVLI